MSTVPGPRFDRYEKRVEQEYKRMLKAIAALPAGDLRIRDERTIRMRTRSTLANMVKRAMKEAGSDPILSLRARRIESRVSALDRVITRDMR